MARDTIRLKRQMKLVLWLAVLAPLFAADPPGFAVWKAADLKHESATQVLGNSPTYQALLVRLDKDGDLEIHDDETELLIVETGSATLMAGAEKKELAEGDVARIPPNLPHQVLVAPGKVVTYLAIRHPEDADIDATAQPPAANPTGKKPEIGIDLGSGFRACVPGDPSPSGTVFDGYRKLIGKSFMGQTCLWAREQDPAADTPQPKEKPKFGVDMGGGYRSCVRGDDSPSGTIVDGYRKVSHPSPFGLSCAWEKIK